MILLIIDGLKIYDELSFESWNKNTKRYYQALKYKKDDLKPIYGMECNGVTLMYFLQSLGLYPIEMTRKEFEYAFTDAKPYGDSKSMAKISSITINDIPYPDPYETQNNPKPISGLIASNLSLEALLGRTGLGEQGGISVVKQSLASALKKLEASVKNFAEKLPKTKGYEFIKINYHQLVVSNKINNKNSFIVDLSEQLANNEIPKTYFEAGCSVFVSVDYASDGSYKGETAHYDLIMDSSVANFQSKGQKYHIYPADDALWGKVLVIAPAFIGDWNEIKLEGIGYRSLKLDNVNYPLHSVSSKSLQIGLLL